MNRRAFSFIELLIAMVFLTFALGSLMMMNWFSTKGGMDAYYEFLAIQLANEPLEIIGGLGYDRIANYKSTPLEEYPLDVEVLMEDLYNKTNGLKYPDDVIFFKRLISLKEIPAGNGFPLSYELSVSVFPRTESKLSLIFGNSSKVITLKTLIVKEPF